VNVTTLSALANTLCEQREQAFLFRTLATLRTDTKLLEDLDQLRWSGPSRSSTPSRLGWMQQRVRSVAEKIANQREGSEQPDCLIACDSALIGVKCPSIIAAGASASRSSSSEAKVRTLCLRTWRY